VQPRVAWARTLSHLLKTKLSTVAVPTAHYTQHVNETSFAITLYGQCRRHVAGQPVVNDISVVRIAVEVFLACVLDLIILMC